MKKQYQKPEITITKFSTENILTASSTGLQSELNKAGVKDEYIQTVKIGNYKLR